MAKSKSKSTVEAAPAYREPASVNVKKASNGYVVSRYGETGERIQVARNMDEVSKLIKNMMKG